MELAYGVAHRRRRAGPATRAVRLVAAWAFAQLGLARTETCVTVRGLQGQASRRVAEKAGFSYEGTRRSFVPATGISYEDRLSALAAPDAELGLSNRERRHAWPRLMRICRR